MTANTIGGSGLSIEDRIGVLEIETRKASRAKALVQILKDFEQGRSSKLDEIRDSRDWRQRLKAAAIVRDLFSISSELSSETANALKLKVERYYEEMETDLLADFDEACQRNDVEDMNISARILTKFNGGQSCMQSYIHLHSFFQSHLEFAPPNDPGQHIEVCRTPLSLSEYETALPKTDRKLEILFDDLIKLIPNEWKVILAVFSQPFAVIQMFLQRVFTQIVQNYIESLMTSNFSEKNLVQNLRVLANLCNSTKAVVKSISKISSDILKDQKLSSLLDSTLARCESDVFIRFTGNRRYLKDEMRSLRCAYDLALREFQNMRNERKTSAGKTVFAKFTGTSTSHLSQFSNLSNISRTSHSESTFCFNEDLRISMNLVVRVMDIQNEALERCLVVSEPDDVLMNYHELSFLFLEEFCEFYFVESLNLVAEDLSHSPKNCIPDFRFLSVIESSMTAMKTLEAFFQTKLSENMHKDLKKFESLNMKMSLIRNRMEDQLNHLLQKFLDLSMGWISMLLSNQKKSDFRPGDGFFSHIPSSITIATPCCVSVCEFVDKFQLSVKHHLNEDSSGQVVASILELASRESAQLQSRSLNHYQNIRYKLPVGNSETILKEFGNSLYSALLEHVRKFTINTAGGLLLSKDLAKYHETVGRFQIPCLEKKFAKVRKLLSSLYIVKSEHLRAVLEEELCISLKHNNGYQNLESLSNHKHGTDAELLKILPQLIANRADYNPKEFFSS